MYISQKHNNMMYVVLVVSRTFVIYTRPKMQNGTNVLHDMGIKMYLLTKRLLQKSIHKEIYVQCW